MDAVPEFDQPVVAVIEQRVSEIKGDLLAEVTAELDIETAPSPPQA